MLSLGNKIIAGSFKSGASWEVGDVGISAFGIDEALNKRRYLNGQVISQAQFVQFTAMLKSRVSVYPNLSTTEVNWQATVTNSDLGQCGQFVIDDVAGTIRLPKVVNINGLQNLALLGGIKAESLPNIKGELDFSTYPSGLTSDNYIATGAIGASFATGTLAFTPGSSLSRLEGVSLDSSRSSSTYQNDAPVQQEAVQYPYFIQVAEGVETSIDVSREIELNNPFTLFQYQWSSFILNNASWLRADTFSWQSGAVYVSAYEQLLTEYNAGTSEIAEGITYRLTSTGKKIALPDQETAIASLYASTGNAWYYILDTENERFKLPRGLHGTVVQSYQNGENWYRIYSDGWCEQGGIIDVNYAQQISTVTFLKPYADANYNVLLSMGGFAADGVGNCSWQNKTTTTFEIYGDYTNSTALNVPTTWQTSGYISGDFNNIEKYLYFYVGETVQDANLINAGAVLDSLANKVDSDSPHVVETYVNGTSWYRVYSDGWCEQGGVISTGSGAAAVVLLKSFVNTDYSIQVTSISKDGTNPQYYAKSIIDKQTANFSVNQYSNYFAPFYWQACGYIS